MSWTRERAREYAREWRKKNPEKERERQRQSRLRHPESSRRREIARRIRDLYRGKRYRAKYPIKYALRQYKADAKKRGLEFILDQRLFEDLVTDSCFYCGNSAAPVNGVDRVDNTRGYETDNVVTACRICNRAKDIHTRDVFEA